MGSVQLAQEILDTYNEAPLMLLERSLENEESRLHCQVSFSKHPELKDKVSTPSTSNSSIFNSTVDSNGNANVKKGTNHILLITIQTPTVSVTTTMLHKVFSRHGRVQKIVIFLKSVGLQALVQFEKEFEATEAKRSL